MGRAIRRKKERKAHGNGHGQQDAATAQAMEQASEVDRRWFAEHPDARSYTREVIPGEFGPHEQNAETVLVTQLRPGVRSRSAWSYKETKLTI